MAMTFGGRLKHAWNAFANLDTYTPDRFIDYGTSYSRRPDRSRMTISNERSIISSIYTRIGIDTASIDIRHVRLDENKQYVEDIESGLNNCLNLEANIDQSGRAFKQDIVMSMLDKGCIAIVPIDTSVDPLPSTGGYDIRTVRVAEIVQWFPRHVKVKVYNDQSGLKEELILPKTVVSIVENPLYSIMNEQNSTLQRLVRKLNLLDAVDEQSSSGKLDIIMQLPYTIRTDARRAQADQRRKDIESQLTGSQYGIAYADATEKITQLNRPAENNLLAQVEYLTNMLYSQLGLTPAVFDGTADEAAMLNYYNRTIEPILAAISEGMKRTFLTKTARSQGQSIEYFRDPFRLVPVKDLAEIADKFTRNEIISSNEMRGYVGLKPSDDPKANALTNKNIPQADPNAGPPAPDPLGDIPSQDQAPAA